MKNICEKLAKTKEWADISEILDEAKNEDIRALAPILPRFLKHRSFVVRASALDVIGAFDLRRYIKKVEHMLDDKNPTVQSYALSAYYDLRGKKALARIRKFCTHGTVCLRVSALALVYVATKDGESLEKLTKILMRRRGNGQNQFVAIHNFEYYLQVENHPEIIRLYKKIFDIVPDHLGLAKYLKKRLNELSS